MKQCTKCKINKELSEYYIHKNAGILARCKACVAEDQKIYNSKNKEKIIQKVKIWAENNKDKTRKIKTAWRKRNPEYHKNYYKKKLSEDSNYGENNYIKYKETYIASSRKFRKENPKHNQEYVKKRLKIDNNFRLSINLRSRIRYAIKNAKGSKTLKCTELTGCSYKELRKYLESKFLPTMTWENYGKYWQVDHIIPCSKFNLTLEEEQRKCFHYTNLQPLFRITTVIEGITYIGNINKNDKIL